MKTTISQAQKKEFVIRDREAGNVIEQYNTLEEARLALTKFKEHDKKEGIFIPNFYEIYDSEKEEVVA